jgi:hypothetical protein
MVASIAITLMIPESWLAFCMASVAPSLSKSSVGAGIPVDVNTRPCFMWSEAKHTARYGDGTV